MSVQEWNWDTRTSGPEHVEAPTNGQEVGDFANAQPETVQIAESTFGKQEQANTGGAATAMPGGGRRVNPDDRRFIRAVVIGTAVAGLVAFSISFAALYEVAAWLGLPPFMHWAVPVFIDLAILVYAGSVLVHQSRGESARASWWALGAFTSLSVIANGAHAWSAQTQSVWQSVVGMLIAAMVPVAVFVATDQLARVAVENPASRRAERAAEMDEHAQLLRVQAELELERDALEAERAAKRRQIDAERRAAEREAELAEARHMRELEAMAEPAPAAMENRPRFHVVQGDQEAAHGAVQAPARGEGSNGSASTVGVTGWIVAQLEAGRSPSAAEIAQEHGCSERTGRRRLADVREARPELFESEAGEDA